MKNDLGFAVGTVLGIIAIGLYAKNGGAVPTLFNKRKGPRKIGKVLSWPTAMGNA